MPKFVYRVFDDQSVSRFNGVDGFVAGNPDGAFNRHRYGAKSVIQRHMRWGNRRPTPFISVTASRAKAVHYARQRQELGHGGVSIAKIDTAALRASGVVIYHMATLVKRTRAHIDPVAWNYSEYLCLRYIPHEAIVEVWEHDEE
ncbi:hypothetical protein PILCRDRAFT_826655 [Piloderma croceum F 1598]|uniref:DUF7587 domain-containing protein n=1 Tax=Piloderma croceum (strain F 1598) TaxID=765440 RepID=A0A0C3F8I0_PILCF|nr:hypothetical protein PILCRDRAFT_826655 [Piloderma croceum F 1598]